jgi:hypothetical protein
MFDLTDECGEAQLSLADFLAKEAVSPLDFSAEFRKELLFLRRLHRQTPLEIRDARDI